MSKIQFSKNRKLSYVLSLVVIVAGLISLAAQGLNYGIDFTGGNILDVAFSEPRTIGEVRELLDGEGLQYNVQEAGGSQFIIRTQELEESRSDQLLESLESSLGSFEILRNEKVSAVVGGELTRNALLALAIASVLMIIYITFRFEFFNGLAAVLALVHDVLVTVGIFSILQIEINSAFVAALLTIVGYSINDTIVIFDRIRENLNKKMKIGVEEVVDLSINQTLFRTISTSVGLIMVLLSLYFLGGVTIRDFVLAMLIGSLFGTYSSIFVASPLWLDLRKLGAKH